jgi:glycosyltransferase involved in cell wall biosynthesis
MGGSCLAKQRPLPVNVEILPVKAERSEVFLSSLDCFLYRTGPTCWEAFGRVIHEALACGLPVVAENRGGYVTSIEHGQNGFLFETNAQALAIVQQLRDEPDLASRVSHAARVTVETMYAPAERAKIIDYYLL